MNDFKLLLDEQNSKIIGQKSLSLIKKKEHNSKKKKITKKNNIEKRQDKTTKRPYKQLEGLYQMLLFKLNKRENYAKLPQEE
ncbi:hypothetical protein Gasu2_24280 [Galdieria sulphuraria]|nr:hypothetical protein Gasu2_24280 [Galdieria sulphuraria]